MQGPVEPSDLFRDSLAVLIGLSSVQVALRQRGCGTPPASELSPGSLTASCPFCRQALIDLGSVHLFCAGCKIFQETPSLLRWETARGPKRTAGNNPACPPLPFRNPNRFGSIGPPQHYEISSRHGSLGLPLSSRLSGARALQSRGAFSRLQAHSFAYPRNAEESLAQAPLGVLTPPCSDTGRGRAVLWPSGPKFFPPGWDPEHSHRAGDQRDTLEVLPAGVLATIGQGLSPPPEPNQGVVPTPARAPISPCHWPLETLPEQQKGRALRGRKRKAPKGLLWASTRRRRAAHRERQLQLSNSLFWLSWQPLRSDPLGYQEAVVPTPPSLLNAPEAQASQGRGPAVPHHAPVHVPLTRAHASLRKPRPLVWQAAVGAGYVAERPSTECPSWSILHCSSAASQLTIRNFTRPL